jgi:hypothetical protein
VKPSASALSVGLGLIFLTPAGVAQPIPYRSCCGGQPIRWNVPSADITVRFSLDNTSVWRAPFAAAIRSWGDLVGSELDLILDNVAGGPTNGVNNAYFSNDPNPNNALGTIFIKYNICGVNSPCCQVSPCTPSVMTEADIVFWVNTSTPGVPVNWSSAYPANISNTNVIGGTNYFAVVASHELGHALGFFNDLTYQSARMNKAYPNGGWGHSAISDVSSHYERLRPPAWDQTNVRILYPAAGTGSRIYAPNVQPESGSDVTQVLSYNPGNQNQTYFPFPPVAAVGSTVAIRICYGNAGNAAYSAAIPIKVYLSSNNDKLDTGDVQATSGWTFGSGLNAGQHGCQNIDFVVPSVPTNQQYHIIYVFDVGAGTSAKHYQVVNRRLAVP